METLSVLSAGAAQELVRSIKDEFTREHHVDISTTFGAVGVINEALLSGAACDVMITSESRLQSLIEAGQVSADSRRDLGRVHTAIAVRADEPSPDISTAARLVDCLQNATRIFCIDPERSTGGGHFDAVLKKLGIHAAVAEKLVVLANGATAMRELVATSGSGLVGCAQATAVLYTPGIRLVGPLPGDLDLATTYTATVASQSVKRRLAAAFVDVLTGAGTLPLRASSGFEDAMTDRA